MPKLNSTLSTLLIASVMALSVFELAWLFGAGAGTLESTKSEVSGSSSAAGPGLWAATATGRIEPKGGELRLTTVTAGRIIGVLVKAGDRVVKNDLLVRTDDADLRLKLTSAMAEADTRKRERDEEPAQGASIERRKLEDAAADADRAVFQAREDLDTAKAGDRQSLRDRLKTVQDKAGAAHSSLSSLMAKGVPLPVRLDSSLTQARGDVAALENGIEHTRIRAPIDATVLALQAKVGEVAAPAGEVPLVQIGDLSGLQVRAEVEARDALKIRVGQPVILKSDALPGREFTGEVTEVAPALGSPHIATRGPRRPNDVEVLETVAKIDGNPQLLPGMRVDVYFKSDPVTQSTGSASDTVAPMAETAPLGRDAQ